MISSHLTLAKVKGTDQYLLQLHNRAMYVSRLLYIIIHELQQQTPLRKIVEAINNSGILTQKITEHHLELIIVNKIAPLNLSDTDYREDAEFTKDIFAQVVLFRFPQMAPLLDVLRYLFTPAIFWTLFCLSFLISLIYILPHWNEIAAAAPEGSIWMIYLGAMFFMMLCHEFGHAAASWNFGVQPKEIGMGIYLCFPVFFANVTGIWQLPAKSRSIVNLAGVHMQLLANLIVIAVASTIDPSLAHGLLQFTLINLLSVLANLNPFFKFDGYWLLADAFHLPHLRQDSNGWLKSIFSRCPIKASPILIIYSIARGIFIAWMVWAMVHGIPEFLYNTYEFAMKIWRAGRIEAAIYHEVFQRSAGMALLLYSFGRLAMPVIRALPNVQKKG